MTGYGLSVDGVAIEGGVYTLQCDKMTVPAMQNLECNSNEHWYTWVGPSETGCLGYQGDCLDTIGGVCRNGDSSTNACWQPCMTVHNTMTLEFNPVLADYEGDYECQQWSIGIEIQTLLVAGKIT